MRNKGAAGIVVLAFTLTGLVFSSIISSTGRVFALDQSIDPHHPPELCRDKPPRFFAFATGLSVRGFTVTLDASHSDMIAVSCSNTNPTNLNFPQFYSWQIESVNGSTNFSPNNLQRTDTLTPTLFLEKLGTYKIKFTFCPNGCPQAGLSQPLVNYITVNSLDSAYIPPLTTPVLPESVLNNKTPHHDPSDGPAICTGVQPGATAPQWRTVDSNIVLPNDYKLVEGYVAASSVSNDDNPLNHSLYPTDPGSLAMYNDHDKESSVIPDPPFTNRLAGAQSVINDEWESKMHEIKYWPSPGDRVSIYGFWIYDCPHSASEFAGGSPNDRATEIHPPVFVADDREQPILIDPAIKFQIFQDAGNSRGGFTSSQPTPSVSGPSSLIPQTDAVLPRDVIGSTTFHSPSSVGTNVYVPGIATEIWVNGHAGDVTTNCDQCLGEKDGSNGPNPLHPFVSHRSFTDPHPINRAYDFNIYLPPSPNSVYASYGLKVPPVPLYCKVFFSDTDARSCSNLANSKMTITKAVEGNVTYLKGRLDLSDYAQSTYHVRIESGWVYPSPDNWGLENWRFKIDRLHIDDDSDIDGSGEANIYFNLQHKDQPWTKLTGYDTAIRRVDSGSNYPSPQSAPWETGPAGSNAFLGPDILVQRQVPSGSANNIPLHVTGWEDDATVADKMGQIDDITPNFLPPEAHTSAVSQCTPSDFEGVIPIHCGGFRMDFTTSFLGSIPASLSAQAKSLYDKYKISSQIDSHKILTSNFRNLKLDSFTSANNKIENEEPLNVESILAKLNFTDYTKYNIVLSKLGKIITHSSDKGEPQLKSINESINKHVPSTLKTKYFASRPVIQGTDSSTVRKQRILNPPGNTHAN